MIRLRPFASGVAALISFACAVAVLALLACEPAPTPTPLPTPTPSPTPTATLTPTATPTPTPTPVPAAYTLAYDGAAFTGAGEGVVEVVFSLDVTNIGEAPGESVDVRVASGGAGPETAHLIERIPGGETAELAIDRSLPPGEHRVTFSIGGVGHTVNVSVQAADLALELLPEYAATEDGATMFEARVTNSGDAPAEDVALAAEWTTRPDEEGTSGSAERAAVIERIEPSESETVSLSLPIPTGAYDLALAVTTASLEAWTNDNATGASIEVEYVDLVVAVEGSRTTGYRQDGSGIVEVSLSVSNEGVGPSGPVVVGVRCADGAAAACSAEAELASIPPDSSGTTTLTLTLPQGATALTAYAGALEHGYRWGERNVVDRRVTVADKPAVEYVLDALATVIGYRQDGTAEVEVSVALQNDGYSPARDAPVASLDCRLEGEPLSGCGGPLDGLALADGFGPAESTARLRVPMGTELRAVLSDGAVSNVVTVPERILGIERSTWECFSDRPLREATYENDFLGGCGGWTSATVLKWDRDEPVRVWADPSGDDLYVRILRETLDGLSPLLNLDFEWVETAEEATLKAFVGVPRSRSGSVGFPAYCADTAGCAGPDGFDDGRITDASMSVWLNTGIRNQQELRDEIEHVTLHEALHALADIHHRPGTSSIMSINVALRLPSLSDSDEALLRLYADPLVRPGMTMPQVQRLIVFADELLDPPSAPMPEDDAVRLAERAYAALLGAGSARFRVRGRWPGGGCDHTFSGFHEIGRFVRGYPRLVHFDNNSADIFLVYEEGTGWTGWRHIVGEWRGGSLGQVYDVTNWRHGFTDPLEMLVNVITHTAPGDIGAARPSERTIVLAGTLDGIPPPDWANGVTLRVSITLDAETYRISDYELNWRFDVRSGGSCSRYEVDASDGEYDVDIPLPSAISGP